MRSQNLRVDVQYSGRSSHNRPIHQRLAYSSRDRPSVLRTTYSRRKPERKGKGCGAIIP